MNLLEEIRNDMAIIISWSNNNIYSEVNSLKGTPYPAWCVKYYNEYGVAVERGSFKEDVYMEFANTKLVTKTLEVDGDSKNCIMLLCVDPKLHHMFSSVCAEFVDPGENGKDRKFLTDDPQEWGMEWRDLLGNVVSQKKSYSIMGEMLVLDYLFQQDSQTRWAAVNGGSHDIEAEAMSAEVKSTLQRYGSTVTISGQHQLLSAKRLELYFVRMEKSKLGISIDDMVRSLTGHGYDSIRIENELRQQGIMPGSPERKERYKIQEKRKYLVDDHFPKITKNTFQDKQFPQNIVHISYTIDLDGLPYEKW